MRLIAISNDNFVSLEGKGLRGIDLSNLRKAGVHAIQFYNDGKGQVEYFEQPPEQINSLIPFQWVIDAYEEAREKIEKMKKEE